MGPSPLEHHGTLHFYPVRLHPPLNHCTSHFVPPLLSARPFIDPALQLSCSFEHQTHQHFVNIVVLVHPPGGLFPAALNVRDQLFRSLGAYQVPQSVIFSSSRKAFLCSRHRKSCPWIASPIVFLLLSSADSKSRPDFKPQGPSSSDLSFSSSHIGLHEGWLLRSISLVGLMILIFLHLLTSQ